MPVMLLTPKTMDVNKASGSHVILHMVLFLVTKILFLATLLGTEAAKLQLWKKRALIMYTQEIHVELSQFSPKE